jgi:Tfp pilus assembly protein PilF
LSKAQRADVKVTVARSLEKAGDIDRAIALYTEAAAADPKRLDACLRLAALDELQGRLKESREWYRKALTLQPDNADVYCDLGYSLYLQGEWTESSKQLQHALRLAPDHARAHNNLGLVLARLGQNDEAMAEFKKGGCTAADAHINVAYCNLLAGNSALARQHLETALKLDPDSAPAKKALQDMTVLLARQQPSEADTSAGATESASPGQAAETRVTSVTWKRNQ